MFISSVTFAYYQFISTGSVSSKTLPTNQTPMCIIIIKQKGKDLSKETIKTSARINPHGLGVVWLDTFQVSYHYSRDYNVLFTDRPFIAHFRYATVGAINKDNTHPFRCGTNSNEWLMMNGTIHGLGNQFKSDSRVLSENLGNVPRQAWKKELEKHSSRFVTINSHSRTFQIYNKELWTQHEGVWFSKDTVIEENLVAVYGTLKKGYNNYNNYLTSSKHIGSGLTKDKYPLIIKGLPYMIEEIGKGHHVSVDVFKVSNSVLANLDKLEGHPTWYRRKQIPIMVGGKTLTCWLYFNIAETSAGHTLHNTYTQTMPKSRPSYFDWSFTKPKKEAYVKPKVEVYEFGQWHDADDVEDSDYKYKEETPMCVHCYGDAQFDGFSNYHCNSCGNWLTQNEVITS